MQESKLLADGMHNPTSSSYGRDEERMGTGERDPIAASWARAFNSHQSSNFGRYTPRSIGLFLPAQVDLYALFSSVWLP